MGVAANSAAADALQPVRNAVLRNPARLAYNDVCTEKVKSFSLFVDKVISTYALNSVKPKVKTPGEVVLVQPARSGGKRLNGVLTPRRANTFRVMRAWTHICVLGPKELTVHTYTVWKIPHLLKLPTNSHPVF